MKVVVKMSRSPCSGPVIGLRFSSIVDGFDVDALLPGVWKEAVRVATERVIEPLRSVGYDEHCRYVTWDEVGIPR